MIGQGVDIWSNLSQLGVFSQEFEMENECPGKLHLEHTCEAEGIKDERAYNSRRKRRREQRCLDSCYFVLLFQFFMPVHFLLLGSHEIISKPYRDPTFTFGIS